MKLYEIGIIEEVTADETDKKVSIKNKKCKKKKKK